ncbi:hypothetical protein CF319_g337 [Tilletia indica]|nr:hypothetical protein CF319_g337 [Tilletia indica]
MSAMTTKPTRRLLIVGVTGNVGVEILRYALSSASPFTHIRGLARTTSKLPKDLLEAPNAEYIDADAYDVQAYERACEDVDSVICAYRGIASLGLEAQLILMRAADRCGVKQMVLASWNYDLSKLKLGDHEPYDMYISVLNQAEFNKTLKVSFIVSGVFFDVLWWFGIWDAEGERFKTYGTGDEKWRLTSREDAARFAVETLRDGKRSGIQYVASESLSLNEISKVFAEVKYGDASKTQPVEKLGSVEKCQALFLKERKEKGKARYLEYIWLGYVYFTNSGIWDFTPSDNKALIEGSSKPWRTSSMRQFISENLEMIDSPPEKIQ